MKKIYFLILILSLIVGGFIFFDLKSNEKLETSSKSQKIQNINPEIFIFHFQPSLKENTEVIINFEKKYLVFKTMYPFIPEPPPSRDDAKEPFENSKKPLQNYFTDLEGDDLKHLKSLIKSLSTSDYKRIEDNYIDGISYNFSILFSDKSLKNAFVAHDKTENQEKIILEVLRLLEKTNKHEENFEILVYYSKIY